ncbi:MAG: alcohol dehydrogenase catalytic domain-containing protein [Microbacterium sp.]
MKAVVYEGPRQVTVREVSDPTVETSHDAVVRVVRAAVCGTDLWWYRGLHPRPAGARMGHEFIGEVVAVGGDVRALREGDLVIAPFTVSDGGCAACRDGWTTSCVNGAAWASGGLDGGQGEYVRVPHAETTLVPVAPRGEWPAADRWPSLLTLSDVLCTGHHAAVAADVRAGQTVAVVGDGAVGISAVLAAVRLGAARVLTLSTHAARQELALEAGATDVVAARGADAVEAVRERTDGRGADAVLECVGSGTSLQSALEMVRDGGRIGYVGIPHDATIDLAGLFRRNVSIGGGMAPARSYIEELLPDVRDGVIDPGIVFDASFTLEDAGDAYLAMDERRAVKSLLVVDATPAGAA